MNMNKNSIYSLHKYVCIPTSVLSQLEEQNLEAPFEIY
jgi:hypothetical protein